MRLQLGSFLLCTALALSACGGGGGGGPAAIPPASVNTVPQGTSQTVESTAAGVIYVAFAHHIDVYPKDASGHPTPIRSITGLPEIRAIATDRFGNLYVSEFRSWTVREFRPNAHGNAHALRVFVATDPKPGASSAQHFTYNIAVRYDGGVVLLGQRLPAPLAAETWTVGVFSARDGGFDIVREGDGFGESLAVDGSGNILFTYAGRYNGGSAVILERLSPHPWGFHDDGAVRVFDTITGGFGAVIAATGNDAVQFNDLRCSENDGVPLPCSPGPDVPLFFHNIVFDVENRLFALSTGFDPTQSSVTTYPAVFQPGQGPVRRFDPAVLAGDSVATEIAVSM